MSSFNGSIFNVQELNNVSSSVSTNSDNISDVSLNVAINTSSIDNNTVLINDVSLNVATVTSSVDINTDLINDVSLNVDINTNNIDNNTILINDISNNASTIMATNTTLINDISSNVALNKSQIDDIISTHVLIISNFDMMDDNRPKTILTDAPDSGISVSLSSGGIPTNTDITIIRITKNQETRVICNLHDGINGSNIQNETSATYRFIESQSKWYKIASVA